MYNLLMKAPTCPNCGEVLQYYSNWGDKDLYTYGNCPNHDYSDKTLSATMRDTHIAQMLQTEVLLSPKDKLIGLVYEKSYQYRDVPFRLSAGGESHYYFDLRKTTLSAHGQFLIGNMIFSLLKEKPKRIGGLTMGADPIATAVAHASYRRRPLISALVIRKEPKKHGTQSLIEGEYSEGDSIVIVDDVLTTGKSMIHAIKAAEAEKLKILSCIVVLDRCEANGRENVEALGYPVESLLTINDFKQR